MNTSKENYSANEIFEGKSPQTNRYERSLTFI